MTSEILELKEVAIEALNKTYKVHEELGPKGEEKIQKNQFGETALKFDIEAERTVIDTLKQAKIPIRIVSEEHGTVDIVKRPKYLGVLDGLDGSFLYKKERGVGRYGTMFAIFSNLDPTYDDYIFNGIMEHSPSPRSFVASKGEGSFMLADKRKTQTHCSNVFSLTKNTKIYIDEAFDKTLRTTIIHDTFVSKLRGYRTKSMVSSAVHYADLVSGETDLVLEATGKYNLEKAVAYGLIVEAGGVLVELDGTSIGPKKYWSFGQKDYIPVIGASTQELAKELIKHISRK